MLVLVLTQPQPRCKVLTPRVLTPKMNSVRGNTNTGVNTGVNSGVNTGVSVNLSSRKSTDFHQAIASYLQVYIERKLFQNSCHILNFIRNDISGNFFACYIDNTDW